MEDNDLKPFDKNCKHNLINMEARLLDMDGIPVAKKVRCTKCGGIGYQQLKK